MGHASMNTTWLDHLRHRGATVDSAGVVSFGGGAEAAAIARRTALCDLSHYGLIRFSGEDSRQYLQGQLSCDVDSIEIGAARYGSYCTPQGRMLASFMLWKDAAGYWMQLPRSLLEPIRKRLAIYILRSKVKAVDASDESVLLGLAGRQAEAALKSVFESIPAAPLCLVTARGATIIRLG